MDQAFVGHDFCFSVSCFKEAMEIGWKHNACIKD